MSAVLEANEKILVPHVNGDGFNPHLLRVEDYEKMVEVGIFGEDQKIELREAFLIKTSPKGSKHANAVRGIDRIIEQVLGERGVFSAQDPIRLDDFSEPEPDVALLAPPLENYDERHPTPKEFSCWWKSPTLPSKKIAAKPLVTPATTFVNIFCSI